MLVQKFIRAEFIGLFLINEIWNVGFEKQLQWICFWFLKFDYVNNVFLRISSFKCSTNVTKEYQTTGLKPVTFCVPFFTSSAALCIDYSSSFWFKLEKYTLSTPWRFFLTSFLTLKTENFVNFNFFKRTKATICDW